MTVQACQSKVRIKMSVIGVESPDCPNDAWKQQTTATTRQLRIEMKEQNRERLMVMMIYTKSPHKLLFNMMV